MKKNFVMKIMGSLIIAFFSINLGLGIANAAMQNTKDYYYGNPLEQTTLGINTSFGNEVVPSSILYNSIKNIKEDVIIGPYVLSEFRKDYTDEISVFFVDRKYKYLPNIKEGKNIQDIKGHIIIGEKLKKFFNTSVNEKINIRNNDYIVDAVSFSNAENNRVNNSIIMSIEDIEKVLLPEYTEKEPFYLEITTNEKGNKDISEEIVNTINNLKGKYILNIESRTYTDEFKESIKPSAYIITGFSILILIITIINLLLILNILIEKNCKKFSIMKAIGSYEKLIALEFIKTYVFQVISSALIGYLLFVIISKYFVYELGIGVYNGGVNLVASIGITILVCIISFIKPYYRIKNLKLVEFLRD